METDLRRLDLRASVASHFVNVSADSCSRSRSSFCWYGGSGWDAECVVRAQKGWGPWWWRGKKSSAFYSVEALLLAGCGRRQAVTAPRAGASDVGVDVKSSLCSVCLARTLVQSSSEWSNLKVSKFVWLYLQHRYKKRVVFSMRKARIPDQ